jgi:outer membrane murein-binding lipoprotein Lpp
MKKYFVFMAVIAATVLFSSCAKVPQAEIDAAKASIEQAKAAQADIYLESEYMALQDSLNAANTVIEEQKSKMFGNYKAAKAKLANVSSQATELASKAEVRKEEVKSEVFAAQAEIAQLMTENNSWVEIAPKGKEGKEAIDAIKSDLASINSSVEEINVLLASDQILAAQTKANAAKQKATEINTELKTVMAKYERK